MNYPDPVAYRTAGGERPVIDFLEQLRQNQYNDWLIMRVMIEEKLPDSAYHRPPLVAVVNVVDAVFVLRSGVPSPRRMFCVLFFVDSRGYIVLTNGCLETSGMIRPEDIRAAVDAKHDWESRPHPP